MKLGLRIDVDTLRGTRHGVPRLVEILARHRVRGSFFFSVGPDNMGRHLWRLLRPTFLLKMLRTKAASLYGWEILLRGTFWPGPQIGERCAGQIRQAAEAGHEIGLHAWDHQRWQAKVDKLDPQQLWRELEQGQQRLQSIIGRAPDCAAAPGWRMTRAALELRQRHPNRYNSDCRGRSIFRPRLTDGELGQPQIPNTLPTYDEFVGPGHSPESYYAMILDSLDSDRLNVLTIHAEVEGMISAALFDDFLSRAAERGIAVVPLGELLDAPEALPAGAIAHGQVPGRDGWLATQVTEPA